MRNFSSRIGLTVLFLLFACLTAAAASPGISVAVPAGRVSMQNPGEYEFNATISALNGFTGEVSASCMLIAEPLGAVNLPLCAESTPPMGDPTITGPQSVAYGLRINTPYGIAIPAALHHRRVPWLPVGGGTMLACLLIFTPKRRRWMSMLGLLVAIMSIGSIGCGGMNGSMSSSYLTTPGTYTFRVTATSVANNQITASTNLTVTIQ
jgi:hypothetical protein